MKKSTTKVALTIAIERATGRSIGPKSWKAAQTVRPVSPINAPKIVRFSHSGLM